MTNRSTILGVTILVATIVLCAAIAWERHQRHAAYDYEPVSYDYEPIRRR